MTINMLRLFPSVFMLLGLVGLGTNGHLYAQPLVPDSSWASVDGEFRWAVVRAASSAELRALLLRAEALTPSREVIESSRAVFLGNRAPDSTQAPAWSLGGSGPLFYPVAITDSAIAYYVDRLSDLARRGVR